jgi:hypothetical protein
VPGVEGVDVVSPTELHFSLSGVVGPLLAVLAPYEPVDLFMSEPDLESAFLGYYDVHDDDLQGDDLHDDDLHGDGRAS